LGTVPLRNEKGASWSSRGIYRVEVLYWSLWKKRWTKAGPFGRTVLSIDEAHRFIATEDIFWATIYIANS
jgi:hypothetical protein